VNAEVTIGMKDAESATDLQGVLDEIIKQVKPLAMLVGASDPRGKPLGDILNTVKTSTKSTDVIVVGKLTGDNNRQDGQPQRGVTGSTNVTLSPAFTPGLFRWPPASRGLFVVPTWHLTRSAGPSESHHWNRTAMLAVQIRGLARIGCPSFIPGATHVVPLGVMVRRSNRFAR